MKDKSYSSKLDSYSSKMYPGDVVTNIVDFIVKTTFGVYDNADEAMEELMKLPEELHKHIMASIMAADSIRRLKNMMN